jgi:Uncharacterized conserved protein
MHLSGAVKLGYSPYTGSAPGARATDISIPGGRGPLTFKVKRVYEGRSPDDGFRVLVDRLWPRGISRGSGVVDFWLRDIAPSDGLRRWFGHRPERWEEFKRRYFVELEGKQHLIAELLRLEKEHGTVTLLFSAKDAQHNNAVALREYLEGVVSRRS